MTIGRDHLEACTLDDCPECDHYLEFYMACEGCGHWGHQESDGWILWNGMPFCTEECRDKFLERLTVAARR